MADEPKLTYQNRQTEWLMGRIGRGAFEVRLEYRVDSMDWYVWSVAKPELNFIATGNYQDVGKRAHALADELMRAETDRQRSEQAMKRAKQLVKA